MAALCNRAGYYIFVLWFLLLSFFLTVGLRSRCGHYIFAPCSLFYLLFFLA